MKLTGLFAIIFFFAILLLSGCVQVIINPPQMPGAATPGITTTPTTTPTIPTPEETPTPTPSLTPASAGNDVSDPGTGFIVPVGDLTRKGYRTFTFSYAPEGYPREYTVRVPVNMSVLYGARESQVRQPVNSEDPVAIRRYVNTFERDPSQDELYTSVLTQLRNARYHGGEYLTDDQYLELIVAFVQQIPYVENSGSKRKYPVEVIYDKAGDTDEKSLLLANLLAKENYDVALLYFEDNQLEEVGIRINEEVPDSNINVFSNSRKEYVYVEAASSGLNFIGNTPSYLKTANNPWVSSVGNGTKGYGQINYNWKIVTDLNRLIDLKEETELSLRQNPKVNSWDRIGTCMWIKNSKELQNTTCYCCDT
nr:hypothetical protein [uncultured Methanoregula sp.]